MPSREVSEALELYWNRISRQDAYYNFKKLGAFGAELFVLANFFTVPWSQVAPDLGEEWKGEVLGTAGFCLRATGRYFDAEQPMKAALETCTNIKAWDQSAICARNLSQYYLIQGQLELAIRYARDGVEYADKSDRWIEKVIERATLASALHQAGEVAEAETLFRYAESIQNKRQSQYPYLYSLQGAQFCDLLLDQERYEEVKERGAQTLIQWSTPQGQLLAIGLDNLTLGRCFLLQAEGAEAGEIYKKAQLHLKMAITELQKAGNQDYIPLGFLALATFNRITGNFSEARDALEKVRDISERGNMRIYLADYNLESCRLFITQSKDVTSKGQGSHAKRTDDIVFLSEKNKIFGDHFEAAKKIVKEIGYQRRFKELDEIAREIDIV